MQTSIVESSYLSVHGSRLCNASFRLLPFYTAWIWWAIILITTSQKLSVSCSSPPHIICYLDETHPEFLLSAWAQASEHI